MKLINENDYFRPNVYLQFLANKIKRGDFWKSLVSIYKKIRKFTLISGIIRALGILVALLEKSALLLLAFTFIILFLPLVFTVILIYFGICFFKHLRQRKELEKWIRKDGEITVYITKERILSGDTKRLFLRMAKAQALNRTSPIIIVCNDLFINTKWYAENILAVKTEYFFILRRNILDKNALNSTYIVL